MRRYCGRPGCSAVAAVTFSFDATARVVWLDDLASGTARAGDLCTRHADALVPPQGWSRVDRRVPPVAVVPPSSVAQIDLAARANSTCGTAAVVAVETDELLPHREPKRKRKRAQRWSDVPSLFDDPTAAPPVTADAPVLELVDPLEVDAVQVDAVQVDAAQVDPTAMLDDESIDPPERIDSPEGQSPERIASPDLDVVEASSIDEPVTAWEPRFDVDDLGGLLDAKSPLLSRAFRAAKTAETDDPSTPDDDDEVF